MADSNGDVRGATPAPTPKASTGSDDNTAKILAALALTPLFVDMLKGPNQPNPGQLLGTLPGGQDLLNGVVGQQQQQAPLRQAVTQQAMNMLPGSAFPGGRPTLSPVGPGPAPVAMPADKGVNWPELLKLGGAAGLGAALAKLAGGNGASGNLKDLLSKLFGKSGPKIQGDKPYPGGALPPANPYDPTKYFTGWEDNGYSFDPNRDRGPSEPDPYLLSDPGVYYGPDGSGAQPTDPSRGTGIGPGMQAYYDSLSNSGGSGGGDDFGLEPSSEWGG